MRAAWEEDRGQAAAGEDVPAAEMPDCAGREGRCCRGLPRGCQAAAILELSTGKGECREGGLPRAAHRGGAARAAHCCGAARAESGRRKADDWRRQEDCAAGCCWLRPARGLPGGRAAARTANWLHGLTGLKGPRAVSGRIRWGGDTAAEMAPLRGGG